jgi:hypothetical protein
MPDPMPAATPSDIPTPSADAKFAMIYELVLIATPAIFATIPISSFRNPAAATAGFDH